MTDYEALQKMDFAAEEAKKELVPLWVNMSEEEKKGAKVIFKWLEDHYKKAGYKRLWSKIREIINP